MTHSLRMLGLLTVSLSLLGGCMTQPKRDPEYAPVPPVVPQRQVQQTGAIYQAGFEHSWFENVRARRVGDILTVSLVEDTEAIHSNAGSVSRSNQVDIANPTLFGNSLNLKVPGTDSSRFNGAFNLGSSSEFDGSGENTQNNEFTGSISVMVTEVLTNGYLRVRGEKRIQMTGGNEYIRVAGIIRPEDISTDNTVASTKIADATLTYVGDGQATSASTMGWLARFFASALFPF